VLKWQPKNLADSVAAIQYEHCGDVCAGLVLALWPEGNDALDLVWVQCGQHFFFLLQVSHFQTSLGPFPIRIHRADVDVD
jgi:hypothetical protein